jgi:hypothetical protein
MLPLFLAGAMLAGCDQAAATPDAAATAKAADTKADVDKAAADAKDLREWTKESSEVCDKMAGTLATWTSIEGVVNQLAGLQVSLEKEKKIEGESRTTGATHPSQIETDSDEDSAPVNSYSLLKGPACFGEEIRLTRVPPELR